MTDWKTVQGSQTGPPQEWDLLSSPTTVYQRKNIEQIEVSDLFNDIIVSMYQYQERTMSFEEYYSKAYEKIDEEISIEEKLNKLQHSADDFGISILMLQGLL